jgi:hypothetical protein
MMVRSLVSRLGVGAMLCAMAAPAAAQPRPPAPPAVPAAPAAPAASAMPVGPAVPAVPFDLSATDFTFTPSDFDFLPPDFDAKVNDAVEKAMERAQDSIDKVQQKIEERGVFAFQNGNPNPHPAPNVRVGPIVMPPMPPMVFGNGADAMYQQARDMIDHERYDQAMKRLNELLQRYDGRPQAMENRVDATLYWKAYTLGKEQQISDALATISDMQKRFADSRWLKDAKALELELRQASGQSVSPDGQSDDDLKLLALRSVMRSDPDRAVPMVDKLLAGNSSVNVKENALFVLSQSQSPRAKEIITNTAKTSTNPDLQLRAVRYLVAMGGADSRQTLDDIYKGSSDVSMKRAILRSFMTSGDRARLVSIAKTETSTALRGDAIQYLGSMHADAELAELYQGESSPELKKRIIQGMVASGNADRMADIARKEKDKDLRRSAIRNLGVMNAAQTAAILRSMYTSETDPDVRKEIIDALYVQKNATALIEMARAEKDPAMKKEIVSRLSNMRNSKEATDYMLELLK